MKKKILVLGSGGREHAFVWSLKKDQNISKIYCAPGNGGTKDIAVNIDLDINKPNTVLKFATENNVDLTIVGPEAPLEKGIVDCFEKANQLIFGPSKYASQLETSKIFAREVLKKCNVKQPNFYICKTKKDIKNYYKKNGLPFVIKVDGLAAGKGVFVCHELNDINQAIVSIFDENNFGKSSDKILIEEFLEGEELSVFAICDGKNFKILNTAQDHKRIYDNDLGPNTGGMGAYSPTPLSTENLINQVEEEIYKPVLNFMEELGYPFKGFLYAGLMLVDGKAFVVEFNVRMGDPETQVVLPLLQSSLYDLILKATKQELDDCIIKNSNKTSVTIVIASDGYPNKYKKGQEISIEDDFLFFHAGTMKKNDKIHVNGGRVLNVVGFGDDLNDAIIDAYNNVKKIKFKNMYFRKDIGRKGLSYYSKNILEDKND